MKHREFALVRVRAESGNEGFAFTLTREGPIAATIHRVIAHHYAGETVATQDDAATTFYRCQGSNLAALASGIGLRALSIVDLAVHDLLARNAGLPMARWLGGEQRRVPATAIIGYPPATMGPDAVREQIEALRADGWRRFKIPIALPLEYGRDRLLAARDAAGADAWLGMDAAWVFRSVDDALSFLDEAREARLAWFEDVFPPGDADIVARLRERADVPIAMGDEQGGSYYPEALLLRRAVDVVRIDLTCMGGITRARPMIDACEASGHRLVSAHVRARPLAGLRRASATPRRSSGACPAPASTSSPTRSPGRSSSTTASWSRSLTSSRVRAAVQRAPGWPSRTTTTPTGSWPSSAGARR